MSDAKGERSVTASAPALSLRRYAAADEDAVIELWRRTWQTAYPDIDFTARLPWWRARWRGEIVPSAEIVLAVAAGGDVIGFVTVDRKTCYLDQIVVAPEQWGSPAAATLLAEAKRLSPTGIDLDVNTDNRRAIRFYEKQGFSISGAGKNPLSGKPVHRMRWRP
jgi:putative acetyltransferase